MNEYSKEVRRLLSEAGWVFLRPGRGDHQIWHDPASGKSLPVDSKIKSRHMANAILKDAGIGKKF